MNVSYLKHSRQSDFLPCPECGHIFTGTRSRRKRIVSYSCPRLISSVLRRKLSILRTIYSPRGMDEPVLCDPRKRKVTKYVEGVRPSSGREAPRREVTTSSYKNLMRDYYSGRFKHHLFEAMHSNELLTDTESECFVKSTDYSIRKIEDDLKHKLIKEYFKPRSHMRHYANSPRPRTSSHKLRMLFLNGTTDFNELKRGSSDSGLVFSLDGNVNTSSAQIMTNQPCCDFLDQNRPSRTTLSKTDHNRASETLNANLLGKYLVTKSNSKLRHQKNTGTQYSVITSRKHEKKCKKRSTVNDKSVLKNMTYEKDIQVQLVSQSCGYVQDVNRSLFAPTISNIANETPNSNLLANSSNFSNSNIKLLKKLKPNARQSNMETQYSFISPRKKRKKWRSRFIVREEQVLKDVMYGRDIQVQTAFPKKQKEIHVNSCRAKWAINHNKLIETNISTKSERLQTILESPQATSETAQKPCPQPHEVMGQPVMCINPSCFFVKGCMFITRENTGTQYDVKPEREATMTEVFSKNKTEISEKSCQSPTEQLLNAPHSAMKFATQKHSTIVQCQQQANKFIQSPCNHNPPCELVPGCFKIKYI